MRWKHICLPLFLAVCGCSRPAERVRAAAAAGDLRVTFLDVGQGDATLLRTPEGVTVLVDAGKDRDTAELLKREGVKHIDLLVLSHAHADHTGGVKATATAVRVDEVWYPATQEKRFRTLGGLFEEAHGVAAGHEKALGGLRLSVLHPEPGGTGRRGGESDVNNGSLVLQASYGQSRYLFPGDCELGCWEELFHNHRSELRSDVLKAAHHGSRNGTSSGVLVNVRPATVVISCGRDNSYGHPHRIVLDLLAKLKAQVFRTDEQGTIECLGAVCQAAH